MTEVAAPVVVRAPRPTARNPISRFVHFVGSFGLAVSLILTLFVLVLIGTIEQTRLSLYDVLKKYFESWFWVYELGPLHIPLPGVATVLTALAVNLMVGGLLRLWRKWRRVGGILVVHFGVAFLLLSGLIEWKTSDKGFLTLYVGGASDRFVSYFEWDLVIRERRKDGTALEHVIPSEELEGLSASQVLKVKSSRLPFDVTVRGWTRNAEPERTKPGALSSGVNGWVIRAREPEMEAEKNLPAAYVTLTPKAGGDPVRGLSWGIDDAAWAAAFDGTTYEVDLSRRTWPLPYALRLNRFVHKEHPGISTPSEFSSYVTQSQEGVERDVHITMNEPLRSEGYTFYQSGWGPRDAGPGARLFSTFSVVKNPSDRWPILSCAMIFLGLVIHFMTKLVRHVLVQRPPPVRSSE